MKSHMRAEGLNECDAELKLYHYCDKCEKRFTSNNYLVQHVRSDHEKIDYICPECPMTFKTHHQYYDHKRHAHSKDERLVCKCCGKRFTSVRNARQHELTHEKPQFQCRFCAKLIKTQDRLEAHERYHTGERPYPCNMCTAAFTSKGRLMQHQKGVHKMAGPRGGTTGWVRQKKNK